MYLQWYIYIYMYGDSTTKFLVWDVFHAPLQEEKKSTARAQQSLGKKTNWFTPNFKCQLSFCEPWYNRSGFQPNCFRPHGNRVNFISTPILQSFGSGPWNLSCLPASRRFRTEPKIHHHFFPNHHFLIWMDFKYLNGFWQSRHQWTSSIWMTDTSAAGLPSKTTWMPSSPSSECLPWCLRMPALWKLKGIWVPMGFLVGKFG